MRQYSFVCKTCLTKMHIETSLDDSKIHPVPPCPCGYSRMEKEEYNLVKETDLGLEEIENPDSCLCLDCIVAKDGL